VRIKITLVIVLLLISSVQLFAQPGDPSQDPDVPITGIEFLIALGGALGIRKLINDRKKKIS
jgi:hypothetical protein